MKKTFKIASVLAVVVCALLCFCACSSYSKVLKAFEKEGYSESDTVSTYQEQIKGYIGETDEESGDVTVHVLYKGDGLLKQVVVIAEFASSKALEEKYAESADLQNLVKDLQNSDYVNGNCVLLLNLATDGLTIFKNA